MRYLFFILAAICMANTACKKYNKVPNDARGGETIYGRLYLLDNLTGSSQPVPLGKKNIFLSHETDLAITGNFLISGKTDSVGYFQFQNLSGDSLYRVWYYDTAKNLSYLVDSVVKPPNDSLILVAKPYYKGINGVEFIFVDKEGGAVPGVKVCVFTSAFRAAGLVCDGSSYSFTSDALGRAYLFGLEPGDYYAVISVSYPTLTVGPFVRPFTVSLNDFGGPETVTLQ